MFLETMKNIDNIKKVLNEKKQGVWLAKIVELTKVPEGSIRYLVYGQTKKGKFYGGYLKDDVIMDREGRNLKIKLKE